MSFDIFFVRSRFRNERVERKNPSTGEVKSIRPQEPLTESELRAVQAVLQEAGAQEPDENGYSFISFKDGGAAEVCTDGLEKGCLVTPRLGLSPDCLRFLIDLLNAAEWVMFPAMGKAGKSSRRRYCEGIRRQLYRGRLRLARGVGSDPLRGFR